MGEEVHQWTSYHLYNVKEDPVDELRDLNLQVSDSGHGKFIYLSEDKTQIFVVPLTGESKSFKSPLDSVDVILAAKRKPLVLIGGLNENSIYTFHVFNTETHEQVGSVEVAPEEYFPGMPVAISAKLSRFAYVSKQNYVCMYAAPYVKKSKKIINHPINDHINRIFLATHIISQNKLVYVITEKNVVLLKLDKQGNGVKQVEIAKYGCTPNLVANDEFGGLYTCHEDLSYSATEDEDPNRDKKRCITYFEGEKEVHTYCIEDEPRYIHSFKGNIIAAFNGNEESQSIKIYNLVKKFIIGKAKGGSQVYKITNEWNSSLILLQRENKHVVVQFEEIDMHEKINQYLKNEQFDVALSIADSQNMAGSVKAEIHKRMGDSEYAKHRFEKAIDQYILTIGTLEPSYVITRFIDPQYAEFLVKYLVELSKTRHMMKQHTTLLFNCYTKLRKGEALKEIVEESIRDASKGIEPKFDVETAVQVLTLGGYRDEALQLARAHHLHMQYVKLRADKHEYQLIFEHLQTVGAEDVTRIVKRYGLDMVEAFKDQSEWGAFTKFLSDCCIEGARYPEDNRKKCKPEDFFAIFLLKPVALQQFLVNLTGNENPEEPFSAAVWDAAIESAVSISKTQDDKIAEFEKLYDQPGRFSDEQLMLFFKSEKFEYGLKRVYMKDDINFREEVLKLTPAEDIPVIFTDPATEAPIDDPRKATDFKHRTACRDSRWRSNSALWRYALRLLVDRLRTEQDKELKAKYQESLEQFIKLILEARETVPRNIDPVDIDVPEENRPEPDFYDTKVAVPFLVLLETVKRDSTQKMSVIKEAARLSFKERQERIRAMERLEQEREKQLVQEDTLAHDLVHCHYKVKQTRCEKCKGVIDLPAKHFLCGHSYHMSCLGENINMCIACEKKQGDIIKRKVSSYDKAEDEGDELSTYMSSNPDPFFKLSQMLQTEIMSLPETNAERADAEYRLKEYQTN